MSRIALLVLITELLVALGGAPASMRHASHRAAFDVVTTHASIARLPRSEQSKSTAKPGAREQVAFVPAAPMPLVARAASERASFVTCAGFPFSANAPVPCARGPPISG